MLSLFRRPGADLQIDVDKTVVQVGDELSARVTLVPKQDFDVQQGKGRASLHGDLTCL